MVKSRWESSEKKSVILHNDCSVENIDIFNHGQKNSWQILTSVEKRDKLLSMKARYLQKQVVQDLKKKMVFISGPRRLVKQLWPSTTWKQIPHISTGTSLLIGNRFSQRTPCDKIVVFWWNSQIQLLTGFSQRCVRWISSGSSDPDHRKCASGHAAKIRRFTLRQISPFAPASPVGERTGDHQSAWFSATAWARWFPEPWFSGSAIEAKRWSTNYRSLLVNQESPSIETISDLSKLELLSLRLPELIGSPLSINGLRKNLQLAHKTVSRWLDILENIYMIFRLPPFGSPLIRAVKKEQKRYHFDWTLVPDMGARFENLVASHLLKWVHFRRDVYGEQIELRYFRDTDKREVDFCVTKDRKPTMFVECKWSETSTSPHLHYLNNKFSETEYYQVTAMGDRNFMDKKGIVHISAVEFLRRLMWNPLSLERARSKKCSGQAIIFPKIQKNRERNFKKYNGTTLGQWKE